MSLLVVDSLDVRHGSAGVLRDIGLVVRPGTAVGLLGANGAGKTTLMRTIIGLHRPAAGSIHFDGAPIHILRADRRARLGIGYCPEGRRAFPGLTVAENLDVACWSGRAERARRRERVFALLPDLRDHRARLAWQLSGGQQQMLALGRALMNAPRLLLLDEPSLGLSPRLTEAVLGCIPDIRAAGTAVLLAEQNIAAALDLCDEVYLLDLGRITRHGDASDVASGDAIRAAFLGA